MAIIAKGTDATKPSVDEEGFLRQPEMWSKDVAEFLAQGEVPGGLTEEHWQVIDYLRYCYLEAGTPPLVNTLLCHFGFDLEYIRRLFPLGLTRSACKIAGIPREFCVRIC